MPVYEYVCEACGDRFEKLVFFTNSKPRDLRCPVCESDQVRRLISAPVVHGSKKGGSDTDSSRESAPEKPAVFGRKELQEALKSKGQ